MHGVIFAELKRFVVEKMGGQTWNQLQERAGLAGKTYLPSNVYPDEELVQLVGTASQMTGTPVPDLLQDFGIYIAPHLLEGYKAQVDPRWKALDLIEHTEGIIHRTVRMKVPGAKPPELVASREGPKRLVLTYTSPRKMCGVAKGIALGVGVHYRERVRIQEPACMHRGDPQCTIVLET